MPSQTWSILGKIDASPIAFGTVPRLTVALCAGYCTRMESPLHGSCAVALFAVFIKVYYWNFDAVFVIPSVELPICVPGMKTFILLWVNKIFSLHFWGIPGLSFQKWIIYRSRGVFGKVCALSGPFSLLVDCFCFNMPDLVDLPLFFLEARLHVTFLDSNFAFSHLGFLIQGKEISNFKVLIYF